MAASALVNERAVIANLADQLWNDVNPTLNNGGEPFMDPADAGYLPFILFDAGNPTVDGVQAFNANDNIVSPAEGALWNAMMFAEDLYDNNDGSFGVHNPFYYEALIGGQHRGGRRGIWRLPAGAAQPDGQGADGQGAEPQGDPVHIWTIEAERRTLSA